MGMAYKICMNCGQIATELHHIVFKSQVKQLENCKLMFQNKLEFLFAKELLNKRDIQETLEIKEKATDSLCKLIKSEKGMFNREDVIRTCMGGKLIIEDEAHGRT